MNQSQVELASLAKLGPREAAAELAAAHAHHGEWLDEFSEHLDRHRAGRALRRTLALWDLNQSQAARLFGVSRQAVSKWLEHGVPAERAEAIADLAAATDLLVHHLKRERIPAVVRRSVPSLHGRSLLDVLAAGETRAVLEACREMFSFEDVHGP